MVPGVLIVISRSQATQDITYSTNIYLESAYNMPGTVLSTKDLLTN